MTFVSGWRLALRLAWREAWRAKGRSTLVLVMITFPVVAVVAADVAQATSNVSSVEGLDRRLGNADARVSVIPHASRLAQFPDPDSGNTWQTSRRTPTASVADVAAALGGTRSVVPLRMGGLAVRTDVGAVSVEATVTDLTSPLVEGLFRLTSGRLPDRPDEVAVNRALAEHGYAVGDTLRLANGQRPTIVGTVESAAQRTQPEVVGVAGLLPPSGHDLPSYLVGGGPVDWDHVRAANAVGATVLSREVVEHPPPPSAVQMGQGFSTDRSQIYAVLALVGVMALLEVVLLAGPAFAVGARRQSRSLALLAANGGTPAQSRRVVLGAAVVLGAVGAAVGVVAGILTARLLLPVLQGMSDTWFGPFQIRWTHLAAIAAFGFLSAFLAAVVPAFIAARQDVVAVLAGRRGDRAPDRRSPLVGLVLLGAGVVVATLGARRNAGELMIAGAAVLSVFGMIFLVPVVVVALARVGRRLPLPLRYAVRDAARHRTRTVPAIAAVAATVAGVVALSIGNTSDQAQAKAQYLPQLPLGMGSVADRPSADWSLLSDAVSRVAPGARVGRVRGVTDSGHWTVEQLGRATMPAAQASTVPTAALVDDGRDPTLAALLDRSLGAPAAAEVSAALRSGRAVVFTQDHVAQDRIVLTFGNRRHPHPVRVPAAYVAIGPAVAPAQAVLPPSLVEQMGGHSATAGLLLTGETLTPDQESSLQEVLAGEGPTSYVYVERGYQTPGSEKVVLWILFGLAGVLMLGGTLTATFLALSDARSDLATLAAVGASPRTRRAVAAAYAVSVGVVGAVLGAAVGFIPGIAVAFPLTRTYAEVGPSHYLDIPWLLILGLVVALPLLTAAVVGTVARSRLPLVARLD